MPTPESHTQDGQEMTVVHRRVPDAEPRGRTSPGPRHIRFYEVPVFAWITACAFTPEYLPNWVRRILAFISWPTAMLFPLTVGLKCIYRTDDFSGVALLHKKDLDLGRLVLRCLPLVLILCAPSVMLFIPGVPKWAFALVGYALTAMGIVVVWIVVGVIVLLISGPLTTRTEGRSKLAPKGTAEIEVDEPAFTISGAAKRLGSNGGVATLRFIRTLIKALPEGSFVVIQPRTASLRDMYARTGFVASGRKDMVLKVPPALPPRQSEAP